MLDVLPMSFQAAGFDFRFRSELLGRSQPQCDLAGSLEWPGIPRDGIVNTGKGRVTASFGFGYTKYIPNTLRTIAVYIILLDMIVPRCVSSISTFSETNIAIIKR